MQTQSSFAHSAGASADVLRMPQMENQQSQPLAWWKQGGIYQLVVPSFQDSNGDGVGDLPGIIERLDYLQWLGVRGIWLSPFYPSPLKDMGYDVMDYKDVHPRYGTLDDFDRLVDEAHRRDLNIVLDWVANHTSDQHPWFQESRSSRDNPKRDWYLWHDPKPDGSPPNNWISIFGGSVWQWDETTEQYYMHTFLPSQVDLNWRHPDVQREMLDVLRFWLDRGVDGFRIDATSLMVKDAQFRDNPPNPDYRPEHDLPDTQLLPKHTRNQPLVHEILAKCRQVVASYGEDRLLAGELYLRPEELIPYYGSHERPELHLPFNLLLPWSPWTKEGLSELIGRYEQHVPADGWSTWTVNTHDCARFASRVSREQSRVAAMLLYTLPGTPTHYYGEELGMAGQEIPAEPPWTRRGVGQAAIATPSGRRCSGHPARTPDSLRATRGCRSRRTIPSPTLPSSPMIRPRS